VHFQNDPQFEGFTAVPPNCKKFRGNAYIKPLGPTHIMAYDSVSVKWDRFNGIYAMEQPGLDNRHRDRNGEIARKHGNTFLITLRKIYGQAFAPEFADSEKLAEVLHKMDEPSLSKLIRDHESGDLEAKIKKAR
jgi:hypothetical protein